MASATRLFVGNLPETTNENDLQSAFSSFGEITNLDLKSKSGGANDNKKFAFVSISASNQNVESCIRHFTNEDFNGSKVYVTRARESFLERLQREREQTQKKVSEKVESKLPKHNPVIKLGDKLNPRKRKTDYNKSNDNHNAINNKEHRNNHNSVNNVYIGDVIKTEKAPVSELEKKKQDSDKKRLESMKKKRQEFKEKKMIIKTGLTGVDKVQNKILKFSDNEEDSPKQRDINGKNKQQYKEKNSLFDDEDDNENDDDLNFEIKKQFEGKKGQKVLDLQSRYKSDKRFALDERFIEDEAEEQRDEGSSENYNETEISPADERAKQLSILQDVLGVTIKTKTIDQDSKKSKPKLGMLRFDPMQPDHAKFLAPVEETKQDSMKKSKKKTKEKFEDVKAEAPKQEGPTVEVSKEQFYKISETLKEAIAQPNTFSLRSLFGNNEVQEERQEQESNYIPLEAPKDKKVKNPLDTTERNPFVYDSSDSETEEVENEVKTDLPPSAEPKAVWKENLFFSTSDLRLKEGLAFFNKPAESEGQKERRELKNLMKKRMYNNDRNNQMFKKKIGGKRKSMKKPYKNKR